MKTLLSLNLAQNLIKQIGSGISCLQNLKEICLAQNEISNLDGLQDLKELEILDLSYNNISELKEIVKLKENKNLRVLSLMGNPISNKKQEIYRNEINQLLPQVQVLDGVQFFQNKTNQQHNYNKSVQQLDRSDLQNQQQSLQRSQTMEVQNVQRSPLQMFEKEQLHRQEIRHQSPSVTSKVEIQEIRDTRGQQRTQLEDRSFPQSIDNQQIAYPTQKIEKESLFYNQLQQTKVDNRVEKRQQQSKINETDILKNQVLALKEMVQILESQAYESHKENNPLQQKQHQQKLELLVQRWREKVFECLVDKKRYEFIIKDNIKNFNNDREQLQKDNKQLQSDLSMSINKSKVFETENQVANQQLQESQSMLKAIAKKNQELQEFKENATHQVYKIKSVYENQIAKYMEKVENSITNMQVMAKKIKSLKQTVDIYKATANTQDSLSKLISQNQHLKSKNIELEDKVNDYEAKVQSIQRLNQTIQEKNAEIEQIRQDHEELAQRLIEKDKTYNDQQATLKGDIKIKNDYIQTLEEEKRSMGKRMKDIERQLNDVKQDCASTLIGKEQALLAKVRESEIQYQGIQQEFEKLKSLNERMKKDRGAELEEIKANNDQRMKEKDKQIRTMKGERDSVFEELKAQNQSISKSKQKQQQQPSVSESIQKSTQKQEYEKVQQSQNRFKKLEQEDWMQSPISHQGVLNQWGIQQETKNKNNSFRQNQQQLPGKMIQERHAHTLTKAYSDIQDYQEKMLKNTNIKAREEGHSQHSMTQHEYDEDFQQRQKLDELERLALEALDEF